MSLLAVTSHAGIVTMCLQDPRRRNALSLDMLAEMIAAFDALTPETRVVILRAAVSDPVWCAGFDIRALGTGQDPLARDGLLQQLFGRLADCPAPVIGMIHGSTWGGGTDLALRCDMLIGDTTAEFAFTPARLGLPYDMEGLLNAMMRVGPALTLEMFATAQPIKADRALQAGILNHLVQIAELETFTESFAKQIADNAPLSVASAKRQIRALTTALAIPSATAQSLAELRTRALSSSDYAEGLAAFAEKRRPCFTGR